ncbi:MAG: hypothetical protein KDE48_16065 [Anaerolineales bacterium]|nr:hypothetical protein [Anaerolineales bacterium]
MANIIAVAETAVNSQINSGVREIFVDAVKNQRSPGIVLNQQLFRARINSC